MKHVKLLLLFVSFCLATLSSTLAQEVPFTYTTDGSTITITGYTGSGALVEIPSIIDGLPVNAISDFAFYRCTDMTEVVIPNSVATIGNAAFYGCTGLTEVVIGSGVAGIGKEAFRGCSGLAEVYFHGNAPTVNADVFYGVTAGTVYYLYGTTGWMDTFAGWSTEIIIPFTYIIDGGTITITGYTGPGGHVVIPSTIDGYPVTAIGDDAFSECTNMTAVVIPNSVTTIGFAAFFGCSGLTKMLIPDSVTRIDDWAFVFCSGLQVVYCQGNAPTAPDHVFPDEVGTVYYLYGATGWGNTFGGWPTAIIYPFTYTNDGGTITITSYTGTTAHVEIPSIIEDLPVTDISDDAFYGCTSLTQVLIPNSVTTIGDYAFLACSGLTNIAVAAENPSFASLDGVLFNNELTTLIQFPGGLIGSYAIPNGVTHIGDAAFSECTSLTQVLIPNSVTSIGDYAFSDCSGLHQVYFQGNAPSSFSLSAFSGTASDFTIYYPAFAGGWSTPTWNGYPASPYDMPNGGSLTVSILPSEAVKAGAQWQVDGGVWQNSGAIVSGLPVANHIVVFSTVSGWITPSNQNVSISSNSTTTITAAYAIDETCFDYTIDGTNATITGYTGSGGNVVIPGTINGYPVTAIGDGAFYYCTALTNVVIGSGVTSIGRVAFQYCTNLTEVVIPDSVTSIGESAFLLCSGLTNIDVAAENPSYASLDGVLFDKTLTTLVQYPGGLIGSYAIPDSVTTIGDVAFAGCTGLTEAVIPDSVTSIGESAFLFCTGLTNVVIGSGVTTIGDVAFAGCTGLTQVAIPDSVTTIGSAFRECYGLTEVVIPDSVTTIGDGAFARCTALTDVVIPDSVTTIGGYAFAGCTGLTEAVIPDSVTSIGESAFLFCTGLTNVVIGSGVTTIGGGAFLNCSSLQQVYFYGNAPTDLGYYDLFDYSRTGTVYYLYGTTGWGSTFGGWPTMALTFVDQDSDRLPDDWETEHFGGTSGQGAEDDYDNDLLDNISEWIAGTDPSDPNSVFEVSVSTNQVPTGFVIEWTSVEDRTYSVRWGRTLTNAYQLLQNGITYPQNSYTDILHHAESTGFYQIEVSTNRVPEGMVLIPGGTNSGTDPDFGPYSLTVDAFYMDCTEVTKAQWDGVYNWAVAHGYSFSFSNSGSGKASNHPVHTVNWYDCVKWCNARSEMEGRTPCYTVSGNTYKTGLSSPVCNFEADGYRLPTSVEWEYAARGGLQGKRFPWGDTITHSQANYNSSSSYSYDISATRGDHPDYDHGGTPYTSPVGSFSANGYGMYDMTGNMWEWCWDASGSTRLMQGGSWSYRASYARCGYAFWYSPGYAGSDFGFRAVCR